MIVVGSDGIARTPCNRCGKWVSMNQVEYVEPQNQYIWGLRLCHRCMVKFRRHELWKKWRWYKLQLAKMKQHRR